MEELPELCELLRSHKKESVLNVNVPGCLAQSLSFCRHSSFQILSAIVAKIKVGTSLSLLDYNSVQGRFMK